MAEGDDLSALRPPILVVKLYAILRGDVAADVAPVGFCEAELAHSGVPLFRANQRVATEALVSKNAVPLRDRESPSRSCGVPVTRNRLQGAPHGVWPRGACWLQPACRPVG